MVAFQRKLDTTVRVECVLCHTIVEFQVNSNDLARFENGESYIQDLFPYLTPGEREMFQTRYCEKCWDKIFPPEGLNSDY